MIMLTIQYDQLHAAIIRYIPQQSLKSRAIKGKERGVAVSGCRSSVAERWWLKPEALGSIPSGATFLSFPLPFQRSTDSNGPNCLSLDDHLYSLQTVFTLTIQYNQQLQAAIIQYIPLHTNTVKMWHYTWAKATN